MPPIALAQVRAVRGQAGSRADFLPVLTGPDTAQDVLPRVLHRVGHFTKGSAPPRPLAPGHPAWRGGTANARVLHRPLRTQHLPSRFLALRISRSFPGAFERGLVNSPGLTPRLQHGGHPERWLNPQRRAPPRGGEARGRSGVRPGMSCDRETGAHRNWKTSGPVSPHFLSRQNVMKESRSLPRDGHALRRRCGRQPPPAREAGPSPRARHANLAGVFQVRRRQASASRVCCEEELEMPQTLGSVRRQAAGALVLAVTPSPEPGWPCPESRGPRTERGPSDPFAVGANRRASAACCEGNLP